ncbi:MAG: hypothetical protein FJ263_11325 [Planctomycetes bacterium]|nr:hypothetical protein [Planctomycetota bacterium]
MPYWKQALDIMGEKTGAFKVVHSDDMGIFTPDALKQFDVICFNNTTKLVPNQAQQKAIMDFINNGKGIVGIHAATDNFYDWPEGIQMMGGVFKGHPWRAGATVAVKIDDPEHPLMKPFGGKGFKVNDEIYRTAPPEYSRKNQRVLMSLDMSDPTTKNTEGVTLEDMDTGISWIKPIGKGRLFYCSLGHNNHLLWNKAVLGHYLAGIQYAAGDLKVDDTPLGAAASKPDLSNIDALIEQAGRCDWDSNRVDINKLQAQISSCSGDAELLGKIETKLAAALQSNITMAGRDFICRQLAVIGTGKSVPALSAMLMDSQATNMARYALEKIPGNAADEAMVNAAQKTKDKDVLIGLVTTLGVRKSESVVSLSKQLLTDTADTDPAAAEAFIQSLGSVGTEAAATELNRLGPRLTGTALKRWPDAMLQCAEAMQKAGQKPQAIAIYQKLYKSESSSVVQAAALRAWAGLDPAAVEGLLGPLISGKDTVLQSAAIQSLVFMGHNPSFLKTVASTATNLSPDAQIKLVTAMPQASREIGNSLAVFLLGSDQESVRIAAYQAIEKAGDKSIIETLARNAVQTQSRTERQAAQEALYRISGKDIDAAILQKIAAFKTTQNDENVIVELIKATVNRQIKDAPEILFGAAGSDNNNISTESIRALQSLAGPEYAAKMVELLISKPGTATENALTAVFQKIPNRCERAKIILDQYPKMTGKDPVQASMLGVLGKLGDVHAVSLLEKEFESTNPTLRQAAFRAMTDWPGDDFIDTMKALAVEKNSDEKSRILAFRAYVRMLDDSAVEGNRKDRVDALIAAYSTAPRLEEKKIVIGTMGHFDDIETLTFLQKVMIDPDLQAEAQASLIRVCEKLLPQNPSAVKPVLMSLRDTSTNKTIKRKAGELLKAD